MTHLTDEELDRARAEEARRRDPIGMGDVALVAARLARTGWTPPPKVNSDLVEAREFRARKIEARTGDPRFATLYRAGHYDPLLYDDVALIRRGREIERANPSKDD